MVGYILIDGVKELDSVEQGGDNQMGCPLSNRQWEQPLLEKLKMEPKYRALVKKVIRNNHDVFMLMDYSQGGQKR